MAVPPQAAGSSHRTEYVRHLAQSLTHRRSPARLWAHHQCQETGTPGGTWWQGAHITHLSGGFVMPPSFALLHLLLCMDRCGLQDPCLVPRRWSGAGTQHPKLQWKPHLSPAACPGPTAGPELWCGWVRRDFTAPQVLFRCCLSGSSPTPNPDGVRVCVCVYGHVLACTRACPPQGLTFGSHPGARLRMVYCHECALSDRGRGAPSLLYPFPQTRGPLHWTAPLSSVTLFKRKTHSF